jgi:2-iminobutanoate/2-iminopropanoate deaminase
MGSGIADYAQYTKSLGKKQRVLSGPIICPIFDSRYSGISNRQLMIMIQTPHAPQPAGHYSQAVVHHGLVFISGQLPKDPKTGEVVMGSITDQTRVVLKNLEAILKAAGSDIDHLLKVSIYVSNISLWSQVNTIYQDFMGEHKPARIVVPSRDLHHGALIEVEAVAAVKE